MRRTLLAPLAILAALALAACSGSSEGTPTTEAPSATATATPEVTATSEATSTATPEPTATQAPAVELVDGIPVGAVGPLAIYVRPNLVGGVSTPTSRTLVNVVDLGAARIVSSWGFGGFGARTSVLGISGTGLVVRKSAFTSEIDGGLFLYDLAGVELRRLYEDAGGSTLLDAQLSHDGSTLAVAQTSASCDNVCTILLDVASGEELQVVPQSAAGLAELGGQFPDPIAWRSDGSGVLVAGQPNGHAFFGWATVFLDGSVQTHDLEGSVGPGPDGRYALTVSNDVSTWESDSLGCELFGTIELHDLQANRRLATFEQPGSAIAGLSWSPDGDELLLAWRELPPAGGTCTEGYRRWDDQPADWLLIETASGNATAAPDPDAIEQSWHPDPRISFECDGQRLSAGQIFVQSCDDGTPVDINANGAVVDSGIEVRIVGTIDLSG